MILEYEIMESGLLRCISVRHHRVCFENYSSYVCIIYMSLYNMILMILNGKDYFAMEMLYVYKGLSPWDFKKAY